ncbi:hypothetical protein ILYODFUR_014962 [Ilyodon furcidens]|uniref:Uncharacterized protein n=1 Tax=Ilyodon furcidens TaxID=33524 RepID=A0ABV0TK78_9TELE
MWASSTANCLSLTSETSINDHKDLVAHCVNVDLHLFPGDQEMFVTKIMLLMWSLHMFLMAVINRNNCRLGVKIFYKLKIYPTISSDWLLVWCVSVLTDVQFHNENVFMNLTISLVYRSSYCT